FFLSFGPLVEFQRLEMKVLAGDGARAGPSRRGSGNSRLSQFARFIGGVVGVPARIEAIEGAPVVAIEQEAMLDALRQVRIGDEVAAEGDQAGDATGDSGLRRVGLEAAGRDDRAVEDLPQLLRGDRPHAFRDQLAALDPGLDDVEIGEIKAVETLRDVTEPGP